MLMTKDPQRVNRKSKRGNKKKHAASLRGKRKRYKPYIPDS
jgi:hypothetical protein